MHRYRYLLWSFSIAVLVSFIYYFYVKLHVLQTEVKSPTYPGHKIQKAPDFNAIKNINERKHAFFTYLKPGIAYENQRILKERKFLLSVRTIIVKRRLTETEKHRLEKLAVQYMVKIPQTGPDQGWLQRMLQRVDLIPTALVLIQAANESAWGTSRFAREANNYFGQWCYRKGCGLIPLAREEGLFHEVAKFASVQESIHQYFMNVNRNRAYQSLREIRLQIRQRKENILSIRSAIEMTNGLEKYSERGYSYVKSIQTMIHHNQKFWQGNTEQAI
jgi:Bax protein